MEIKAVIGANWGDEGKGLMTHHFAKEAKDLNKKTIVVCNNGGAQRGHTVVTSNGVRHVFHHFGSGTLDGADTYLPEDFILNPMTFMKELSELRDMGYSPKVFVSQNCRWSTPYDMLINQITEDLRGNNRHGSCGMGIWETILRTSSIFPYRFNKYSKIKDVKNLSPDIVYNFVLDLKKEYTKIRLKNYNVPGEWSDIISSDGLFFHFMQDLFSMSNYIKIADISFLNNYDTVIFENGQGLMLDTDYAKDVKNTTPSNTGIKNIYKNIIRGNLQYQNVEVCYVSRTYATRHGAGFLPNECNKQAIGFNIEDATNQYNQNQGDIRYGILDQNDLIYRINKDFSLADCDDKWTKSISFTHMNEFEINNFQEFSKHTDKIYVSDNEKSAQECQI